jgi:hypothetical protein
MHLLTRQQNVASRHPRQSGIGQRNKLNSKKDSVKAGMTELEYLIAMLIDKKMVGTYAAKALVQHLCERLNDPDNVHIFILSV